MEKEKEKKGADPAGSGGKRKTGCGTKLLEAGVKIDRWTVGQTAGGTTRWNGERAWRPSRAWRKREKSVYEYL